MAEAISRRQFAAGGLAALQSAPVASAQNKNDEIRIGLIGCGGRGMSVVRAFLKQPSTRVVAICDVDQSRIKAALANLAERQSAKIDTFGDFRRLVERSDIDAVLVATPDHWHAIPAMHAMRAGKDVYLEKPVAHTIEEGRMLVKTARKQSRPPGGIAAAKPGSVSRSGRDHSLWQDRRDQHGQLF